MNDERTTFSSSVEEEYAEIAKKGAWLIAYQKIGRECQQRYTYAEAKKPQNVHLNRYRDVSPYDHSRVILTRSEKDYINANFVKIRRANRTYILTQGPLVSTVGHFWLMVWEQNSRAILMLNKIIEKNEIKCHWYWPHGIGDTNKIVLPDVQLTVTQINEENFGYYSTREFRITDMKSDESREVIQFHYTTWPDFGVPSSPVAFLNFLEKVRSSGALDSTFGPAVVHCSAGIGRSGTFCLVDSCLVIMEKEGPQSVNVQQILLKMRKDRMGLIQTPDQLRFSYQAIIEGAKKFLLNGENKMNESIYSAVAEDLEEGTPPPPPPRAESLIVAPVRPLPAIPTSVSLGHLNFTADLSSSDECPPTPPTRNSLTPTTFTDDENEDQNKLTAENDSARSLRRRRTQDLFERVSAVKRRARDAERSHSIKRFLYKSLSITFGFLFAGIVIYTYVKH